ncbi:MAG: hypothetical protein ABI690_32395 [Chloroflexota bacterium]
MTEIEDLVIQVTHEKRLEIEVLARQHGYETVGEYLLALVDMQQEEPTKAQILADLKQSLYEVKIGQTMSAADFLTSLDSDE